MTSRYQKRKHEQYEEEAHESRSARLSIQAHEADLVRGPQAVAAARSLEVLHRDQDGKIIWEPGDGLIRWNGDGNVAFADPSAEDRLQLGRVSELKEENKEYDVWIDRYDARLLLDALPEVPLPTAARAEEPSSPGGWSDFPSDAEDTFFFSTQEVEDYRREKRRRVFDEDRQARLRAIRSEVGDEENTNANPREEWGGSDEEPDETQRELMRRTAAHVHTSPNPAQLEMRILANHGADPRFAFLRGRWSRAWRLTKSKVRLELEAKMAKEKEAARLGGAGIGGLAGYGDSDDDEGSAEKGEDGILANEPVEEVKKEPSENTDESTSDDVLKAARRERAREWAEKRRAAKEAAGKSNGDDP